MTIQSITVIDDDPLIRELLLETLEDEPYETTAFASPVEAMGQFTKAPSDVVFTDLMMPEMSGLDVIRRVREAAPETSVFLMTAHHSMDRAVDAMRLGAEDYLCKPFPPEQIEVLLAKATERRRLVSENSYLRNELQKDGEKLIVGDSPKMNDLISRVGKVAASKASVMIHGETGSGKELVARALHRAGDRADKPFVKVNCAALAENLLESELFGHEKGSFTGAETRREGRFELADSGTILLDEVSEISPRLQAKLLRVLEEEEFERVGGSHTISIDVRVISTTNRDLEEEISKGRFRKDLFYRLNVVPLSIPPLRERTEDIPMLAKYFLDIFARANGRDAPSLPRPTIEKMKSCRWPGNVRELKNLMHRAVVMGCREVNVPCEAEPDTRPAAALGHSELAGHTIEEVERKMIFETLEETDGNKTAAAGILGVTPRTLRNKLNRYRSDGYDVPPALAGRPRAVGV